MNSFDGTFGHYGLADTREQCFLRISTDDLRGGWSLTSDLRVAGLSGTIVGDLATEHAKRTGSDEPWAMLSLSRYALGALARHTFTKGESIMRPFAGAMLSCSSQCGAR